MLEDNYQIVKESINLTYTDLETGQENKLQYTITALESPKKYKITAQIPKLSDKNSYMITLKAKDSVGLNIEQDSWSFDTDTNIPTPPSYNFIETNLD